MSDRRVITDFVTPFVVAPSTLSPIITGYNGVKPPFTTVVNDISASPSPYFHGSSWEAEEDVEAHNLNLTAVLPLQTPPPPSTMRICLWAICVVGIVLNSVVLRRNTAYSKWVKRVYAPQIPAWLFKLWERSQKQCALLLFHFPLASLSLCGISRLMRQIFFEEIKVR